MENYIILSICIPTYNRAEYLEQTILSIVNQNRFQETNDVEIVISDNCSSDDTTEVSQKYIGMYGDKIRYYRNSENIGDLNFEKVLSYGKGLYLKLNNDTLIHQEISLTKIIDAIKINIEKKDLIFFSNGSLKNFSKYYCKDLNSFVKTVSFYSTWIICFGIWKKDFDTIRNFSRSADLQLVQTDVLLRLINSNKYVFVDNSKLFNLIHPKSKGGYSLYKVFVKNYLGLLEEYRVKRQISWFTLFNEKSKLMRFFLIPWTFTFLVNKTQYSFNQKGAFLIVLKKYIFHPIFYFGILLLFLKIFKYHFKKLRGLIMKYIIKLIYKQ